MVDLEVLRGGADEAVVGTSPGAVGESLGQVHLARRVAAVMVDVDEAAEQAPVVSDPVGLLDDEKAGEWIDPGGLWRRRGGRDR